MEGDSIQYFRLSHLCRKRREAVRCKSSGLELRLGDNNKLSVKDGNYIVTWWVKGKSTELESETDDNYKAAWSGLHDSNKSDSGWGLPADFH